MSQRRSRNGGNASGQHVQSIKQIHAEAAFLPRFLEITIAGGNETDIRRTIASLTMSAV